MTLSSSHFSEEYARARQARPFLKWAGGKSRFLQIYGRRLPTFTGKFVEPFLGGGSVFFYLARAQERPFFARLGDSNRQLIRCYLDVRDHPLQVHERLQVLQAGFSAAREKADYYYELRDTLNRQGPTADAATFIFLNRTCWNGLWRVNAQGKFNVPYGLPKSDAVIPSQEELLNASAALRNTYLRATSWEHTLAFAEPGDFVFLDPPYFSDYLARETSTKYQRRVFGAVEHEQLADAVVALARRGIAFVLTNSGEPEMARLYRSKGLHVEEIGIPRNINSRPDERQAVRELMVTAGPALSTESEGAALLDLEARRRKAKSASRVGESRITTNAPDDER